MPKAKRKSKTTSNRPAQRRLRVQRVVRRLRDIANQIDQMCAAAEKDDAFEFAGIGGTYLVDASNDVHCAINALSPNDQAQPPRTERVKQPEP